MTDDKIKHSEPISIPNSNHAHSRSRSASFSPSSSVDDNSPPLHTPSSTLPPPRVNTAHSPSTSPILSYFFQSPGKVPPPNPTAAFGSLGRGVATRPQEQPILEEDEERESSLMRHMRRMSTSAGWAPSTAPRFNPARPSDQTDRGAGLLRRLSLGTAFTTKPQPPSPPPPTPHATPVAPTSAAPVNASTPDNRKKRRASTLGVPGEGGRPRRAPSPMGERILTGHFDGFN